MVSDADVGIEVKTESFGRGLDPGIFPPSSCHRGVGEAIEPHQGRRRVRSILTDVTMNI
jgi:hypothetical protein